MKRVIFLAIALVIAFCLVGCNASGNPNYRANDRYNAEGYRNDLTPDDGMLGGYNDAGELPAIRRTNPGDSVLLSPGL